MKNLQKSFTLIELLIVIGILGVLVVTVLVTLNPQEAQRKARDTKRMKDLSSLQTAVQQYLDAGGAAPGALTTYTSNVASPVVACNGTGWLGINVCSYISTLPIDPSNFQTRASINAATCTTAAQAMFYRVTMDTGGNFEANVRQESTANCTNVTSDGGNSPQWAEAGSLLTLIAN